MPHRKKLITAAKLLVVALVAWFIVWTARDAWDELRVHPWQLRPLWLAAAGGLYLAGLLPCAVFWHTTLVALGQGPRWGETLRAYYIGHLGKYVPGKALVVVLRAGLLRSRRVSGTVAAVSVFYETLTMMAVGALLAAGILAFWFRDQWGYALLALGLMAVSVVPTLPPVFRRLARLAGVGRRDPAVLDHLQRLGYGRLAAGWLMIAAGWLLLGLSLWAALRGVGVDATPDGQPLDWLAHLPLCTAAVALAVVFGFLSLIPGGAGVREAVLLALLQVPLGKATALVTAVLLRLVWLLAELAISGILYVAVRNRRDELPAERREHQAGDSSQPDD